MEAEDLELRLGRFKQELQSALDAMQHAQRMRSLSTIQQFEGPLDQLRQDLATITSRMASQAELQKLRQSMEALGGTSGQGGLGREVVELLPRLMQELTRLREGAGGDPGQHSLQAAPQIEALQARVSVLSQQLSALSDRQPALRAQDLESRVRRETEEREQQFEALRGGLEALKKKFSALAGPQTGPPQPTSGAQATPGPEEYQALRRELDAGLEAVRTAIPAAIRELRRQMPQARDHAPASALDALSRRLEALEARDCAPASALDALSRRLEALEVRDCAPASALEGLSRRLEALEVRDHAPASVLEGLSGRLETLELEGAPERQHVREVFRDLLEEHDLLLRRLESRLTLLVQDVHRLSEDQDTI